MISLERFAELDDERKVASYEQALVELDKCRRLVLHWRDKALAAEIKFRFLEHEIGRINGEQGKA